MKWYFALNEKSKKFMELAKTAVISCLENTNLQPVCLFDGESCEFTEWLKKKGVVVVFHRVSFYESLIKYYDENLIKIASGTFMRCDIPIIEKDEKFVLYTDCDVLFLKDFKLKFEPKYFACSSQFNKNDFKDFNAGVMLINILSMRNSYEEFVEFIKNNLDKFPVFDQSAYQFFYGRKCEKLPIIYNYKPYWGYEKNAVILHFHGAKPYDFKNEETISQIPKNFLRYWSKEGYIQGLLNYNKYSLQKIPSVLIEKMKNDEIVLKPYKNSFLARLKNRLKKEFNRIKYNKC